MAEESIGDLFGRVKQDGQAVAQAEIGVWKAIAAWRVSGLKTGVPLLVGAVFLLQAALTALLVGLILTLAPELGPGWATLLVFVVGVAIVGLLAWIGVQKCRTLTAPLPAKAQS